MYLDFDKNKPTSMDSGAIKEKTPGFWCWGFLMIMAKPTCMKGLEKSTTLSRSAVIVNGAMAMSASFKTGKFKKII